MNYNTKDAKQTLSQLYENLEKNDVYEENIEILNKISKLENQNNKSNKHIRNTILKSIKSYIENIDLKSPENISDLCSGIDDYDSSWNSIAIPIDENDECNIPIGVDNLMQEEQAATLSHYFETSRWLFDNINDNESGCSESENAIKRLMKILNSNEPFNKRNDNSKKNPFGI